MITKTIATAIESQLFEKIIVSTDDEEIAQLAKKSGAEVPKLRDSRLADDFSTTGEVIQDALGKDWIGDLNPKYVCCIYATTPLLKSNHLKSAYNLIEESKFDYVFPAVPYAHPIQRSFSLRDDDSLEMLFPEYMLTRSQDLTKMYHDAGQFYWGTFDSWLQKRPIFGDKSGIIPAKANEFVDIDNWEDLYAAEMLLQSNSLNKQIEF
jgi:N-acylneuraminate cytidylyltransferase